MKKIDFGQAITVLANIGVLLGILLLVYELSQNRAMMEAQTRTALQQGFNEWIYNANADLETSSLDMRGNRGDELTEEERVRYTRLRLALLRYYENVHYQYRIGLYDEEEFAAQREAWRRVTINNSGTRDLFCGSRSVFSPYFVAELEGLLEEPCE